MKRSRRRGPAPWIGDQPGGNYVGKATAAAREIATEGLWEIHSQHDDWCGFFGGRPCDCDPDITLRRIA